MPNRYEPPTDLELEIAATVDESMRDGIPRRIQRASVTVEETHVLRGYTGDWATRYQAWIKLGDEQFTRECKTLAEAEMFIGDTIMAQYGEE
jgi:hypothetical protein